MPDSAEHILSLTAQVVSAHAGAHKMSPDEVTDMIAAVHSALLRASKGEEGPAHGQTPAVPIEDSLRDDALVCLEDGLEFQSLKRHLRVKYNLTPEAYRENGDCREIIPWWRPNMRAGVLRWRNARDWVSSRVFSFKISG